MSRTLSEADSKALLAAHGVPFAPERLAADPEGAAGAADELGYPAVVKLCGASIAHKTERGLVRLGLPDAAAVRAAAAALLEAGRPEDDVTGVLVAPMLSGTRELIAGMHRDAQFGPTVMIGVGGVLAEVLADVAVRLAPIERVDAEEMLEQLRNRALLGEFRGEPPVDLDAVAGVLLALSRVAEERPDVVSIDLNPLIVHDGHPVAVDALVELAAAEVAP